MPQRGQEAGGILLPLTIHPARVIFVTGVRAAESSAPTVGSVPCTIQPARVGIVTLAEGDS